MTSQETKRRLTVQEAAEALGATVDAIRMRVRRGTLASEKDPDGRVYVHVDFDESETKHRLNGESGTLISAKDETIRVLSEQLEAEREANRENRRIIAALTSRIPAIEAPENAPESPEARSDRDTPSEAGARPQEHPQRRSWWRRWLEG